MSSYFRDKEYTMTLSLPFLYIISYTYHNILVIHLCCFRDDKLFSIKVFQIVVTYFNLEIASNKVCSLGVYYMEDHHHLFLISPSWVNTTPNHVLDAL